MSEDKQSMEVLEVEGPGTSFQPFNKGKRGSRRREGVSAEPLSFDDLMKIETRVIPKSDQERIQIRAAVKGNFLFSALDEDQMRDVVEAMESKCYKAQQTIIQVGTDGDEMFVLGEGECECFLTCGDEAPKMVKKYEPGESFGELALMYNTTRAATIKAKTAVQVWAMDRATFRKLLLSSTAAKRDRYDEFLGKVPLLASLDKYERSKVADALVEGKYQDGDYILKEGDTQDTNFYIMSEGNAVATKVIDASGELREVMSYKTGDFFGELALITQKPRAANVVAKGSCKCVFIDKASFNRLLGPCENLLPNPATYKLIEKKLLEESKR